MAVPEFLSSSYYYHELTGISNVQDIITDFIDQVTHFNIPAWTNPSGNLCVSPVDAFGRFFGVNFTATTQYKLDLVLRDQNAVTICTRRLTIASANTVTVRIFTGEYHYYIDVANGSAAPGYLHGGILDLSPEAQNAHDHYVYGNGSFTTADAATSFDASYSFMMDNVTAQATQRVVTWKGSSTAAIGNYTPNGGRLYRPKELYCKPTGEATNSKWAGRVYQQLLVPDSLAQGVSVVVPIDVGATGTFMVCGAPPSGSDLYRLHAVRIA